MPLSTQEYKCTLVGCQKNLTKCQDWGGGGGWQNDCLTEIAGLPAPRWKGEGVRALASWTSWVECCLACYVAPFSSCFIYLFRNDVQWKGRRFLIWGFNMRGMIFTSMDQFALSFHVIPVLSPQSISIFTRSRGSSIISFLFCFR